MRILRAKSYEKRIADWHFGVAGLAGLAVTQCINKSVKGKRKVRIGVLDLCSCQADNAIDLRGLVSLCKHPAWWLGLLIESSLQRSHQSYSGEIAYTSCERLSKI